MPRAGLGRYIALAASVALFAVHTLTWLRERARAREIARDRPSTRPHLVRTPTVSVLVAAWNEGQRVEAHVRSLLRLRYPDLQIVLCAGGTDRTYEHAAAALGDRGSLLRQERGEGKQAALRRCLEHATGELIYLTDADCLLDDATFERTIEPLTTGALAATGRSRPDEASIGDRPDVLCQWAPLYVAETALGDSSPGLLGRNCAVRRDTLMQSGGFAAEARTGTDYVLSRQLAAAGASIAFARYSFVETAMPETVGAYVRQQSRWLRNHWIHGVGSSDHPALQHALRTWAIGLLICATPFVAPFVGSWILTPWSLMLLHGSAARVRYVAFVATAEDLPIPWRSFLVSPVWFLIDAISWSRSFLDVISPARRDRW